MNSSVLKSISCLIFLTLTFSSYAQEVRIRKQVWHEKNLDLAFFRNGDPIPQAQSKEEWTKAIEDKQPAWCYYDNDSTSAEKRGKLYNWYAVNDKRGLAPKGWRVPNLDDIRILNDFYLTKDFSKVEEQQLKNSQEFIERLKTDFQNASNDSLFVVHHSDDYKRNSPVRYVVDLYTDHGFSHFSQEEIEFLEKQDVGSVTQLNDGDDKITLFKVVDQREIEYVSMKYLLIDKKEYTDEEAMVLADSILQVIKEQNNFAEMVQLFSADPGSIDRGGVYEDFRRGIMVKEIENFVFDNQIGELGIVLSNYGVSVLQVLNKKTALRPVVVKMTKKIISKSSVAIHLKDKKEWKSIPVYVHSDHKFKAVPSGYRANDGQFQSGEELAMFWTQTVNEEGFPAAFYLFKDEDGLEGNYFEKDIGISVRCIKE